MACMLLNAFQNKGQTMDLRQWRYLAAQNRTYGVRL